MDDLVRGGALVLGFVALLFAGAKYLPGTTVEGRSEAGGGGWSYRINGLALFAATHVLVATETLVFDRSLAPVITCFWSLFFAANLVALMGASLLYWKGRATKTTPGSAPREFVMGVELNPRWLGVDLKMFGYQPSLIGLGLIVAAFAYEQYARYGHISPQMGLFQLFWWLYLATHYYYEEFMLTTWDVIAEKFGLALLWGDLVLVPFFYSIGGWYLIDQTEPMSLPAIWSLIILYLFGLWMFRSANAQKHRFKKDTATRIWGQRGRALDGKLLVSGWWGLGRHLNYTGEILVYMAISLTTGFASPVPYLLPLWMCGLLAHRAARDDRRCRSKYGELWSWYCGWAKFRMVPFVY